MPSVRVETRKGLSPKQKRAALDAIHDSLVAAFGIPAADRLQRLVEYEPGNFDIPPGKGPHYMVITVEAFSGRSEDAKRLLYKEIVGRLEPLGVPPADVLVVVHDVPRENWGLGGGVAASDMDLGFEIEV